MSKTRFLRHVSRQTIFCYRHKGFSVKTAFILYLQCSWLAAKKLIISVAKMNAYCILRNNYTHGCLSSKNHTPCLTQPYKELQVWWTSRETWICKTELLELLLTKVPLLPWVAVSHHSTYCSRLACFFFPRLLWQSHEVLLFLWQEPFKSEELEAPSSVILMSHSSPASAPILPPECDNTEWIFPGAGKIQSDPNSWEERADWVQQL